MIRIENHKTGAGVRITCDRPLSKFVFWVSSITLCPAPYKLIKIAKSKYLTGTLLTNSILKTLRTNLNKE